ncbi:MAG: PAS domain-containing protein [Syntrophobacteraceae bacterium]
MNPFQMIEEHMDADRSLLRTQNTSLVLISFALIGCIAALLYLTFTSQMRIQNFALEQLRLDAEKRAGAFSYFFMERRNDLKSLVEQRELSQFFENKALGMSMKYGLGDSLFGITKELEKFLREKQLGDRSIYTRVLFMNRDKTILTGFATQDEGEEQEDRLLSMLSDNGKEDVELRLIGDEGNRRLVSDIPYTFKQEGVGRIIAFLAMDTACDYLLRSNSIHSKRTLMVTDEAGQSVYAVSSYSGAAVRSIGKQADRMAPGEIYRNHLKGEKGLEGEVVAVRMPIQGTPLYLLSLAPVEEIFSGLEPAQLLALLGTVCLVILGGMLLITRINARKFVLQARLDETAKAQAILEERNALLQKEITERLKVEESLRSSEERFSTFMSHLPAAVFIKDPLGRFLFVNQYLQDLLGLQDCVGKTTIELFSDELALRMVADDHRVLSGGLHTITETIGNGSNIERVFETLKFPVHTGQEITLLGGIALDITERKRAEVALRESEARLLTLINATPDIICFKDERGAWMLANESILDLYHLSDVDYRNRTEFELADFTAPIYRDAFKTCTDTDETAWCKGSLSRSVEVIPDTTGESRVYDVIKIPVYNPDGSRKALVVIGRDMTEFKRAEEEKIQLQAQLVQAQKMESVGRLAGGVAHDFNNKIQVILGYVSLALDEILAETPVHHCLMEIQNAAQQSADLTRQLLAFARKQTIRPQVIDLNETVSGLLKMLQRIVGEDIELHWMSGRGVWNVNMDPAQIDQILVNLVVNSRDAIAGTGTITLKTENASLDESYCAAHPGAVPGNYVLLTEIDDGAGMSQDVLESIFEPFFTTKEVGKGTGLGLATVYGIVKQNNGHIDVRSEPGRGVTFKIYLPRHDGMIPGAKAEVQSDLLLAGTESVLIVEDEEAVMNLGKMILERRGYRVITANAPGEAIRLVEHHDGDIHLLISDVVMPEMNGRELAARLTLIKPGMKCLFMSGYTADVIAHHGVLDEEVDFLEKPFSVKTLVEKVREVLDG